MMNNIEKRKEALKELREFVHEQELEAIYKWDMDLASIYHAIGKDIFYAQHILIEEQYV